MKKLYLDVKNGIDEISLLKLLAEISKDLSPDALSKVNRIFVIRAKDNIKEWITNLKIKGSIKKHILNIYRKLGIRNRVQLFKKIREKE